MDSHKSRMIHHNVSYVLSLSSTLCGRALVRGLHAFRPRSSRRLLQNIQFVQSAGDGQWVIALDEEETQKTCYTWLTHPVEMPHWHILIESIALRRVRKKHSARTPRFQDTRTFPLTLDLDDQAMVGGLAIVVLMTKVPGQQLKYDMFWYGRIIKEGRRKMRESSKTALL